MKQIIRILSTAIFFICILQACTKPSPGPTPPNNATVTTIAGNGTAGFVDGTAANAEFNHPWGLAIDQQGNIYVADEGNNRIRQITTAGLVSTLAGNGTAGFADGTGINAEFNVTNNISTDAQGNVYVPDENNERIRKISSQGVVITIAGNGIQGNANGLANTAEFNGPSAVCVDAQGNVYVSDQFNNIIRKITLAGVVSTLAGNGIQGYADGIATNAEFNGLGGMVVDAQGNVYVGEIGNNRIRRITPEGVTTTIAGNGIVGYIDNTGTNAEFSGPIGLAMDSQDNIYATDYNNNVIRKITSSGVVSTLAGNGTAGYADGAATNAEFDHPWGVAVDAQGNVYVSDGGNNRVRKITIK